MKVFAFKAHYYDEWDDKEIDCAGITMAEDMVKAMEKICNRLPYASPITINEMEDTDFIWFNEENYEKFVKDEGCFDPEEEKKEYPYPPSDWD